MRALTSATANECVLILGAGPILAPTDVRVLLVEQDPAMVRILERGLRAHGFEVTSVDGRSAAAALSADALVRIIVLDMPAAAPATQRLAQKLRDGRPQLPLLYLTARDEATDGRLAHLNADEYLAKPFAMEELIARIRARTRSARERRVTTLTAGDLRLDLLARCAWRGEQVIDLPSREFALLEYFMRHPSRVLSRQAILSDVWGYDLTVNQGPNSNSNVVDVYVRYLRNRLYGAGGRSIIATVRGEGYRFNPPSESESTPAPGAEPARSAELLP
jgi:DNA-binding response OmpR family regulator